MLNFRIPILSSTYSFCKKQYQVWKYLRRAIREGRALKKEAEAKRKREWSRFFNQHSL